MPEKLRKLRVASKPSSERSDQLVNCPQIATILWFCTLCATVLILVPKSVGLVLNPWGGAVQESCIFRPVVGFSQSKAETVWLCSTTGIRKKASFKCSPVKPVLLSGTEARRGYGFGTTGCTSGVLTFTPLQPCTNLCSGEGGFLTSSIGALNSD